MSKYFAKYLPVEGEIKGWCRYKPTGNIFYQQFGNNAMYDKPNGKLQYTTSDTIAYEKIQLFLCSRDIQVGNNIKGGKGMNMDLYVNLVNGKMTYHVIEQQGPSKGHYSPIAYSPESFPEALKVIGPISPEATWVTEGMEFDKSDVKGYPKGTELSGITDSSPNTYRIKGPCGHFH